MFEGMLVELARPNLSVVAHLIPVQKDAYRAIFDQEDLM
jgi:hypothetical protein